VVRSKPPEAAVPPGTPDSTPEKVGGSQKSGAVFVVEMIICAFFTGRARRNPMDKYELFVSLQQELPHRHSTANIAGAVVKGDPQVRFEVQREGEGSRRGDS